MKPNIFALPEFSRRFIPIWRRNFMVWKKMAGSSILGHLADPVIYMLGLGYGLGGMLPQIGGTSYIAFLAAGNGVLQHHEQRQFRGVVFRFRAHARAAHLGCDSQYAGHAG